VERETDSNGDSNSDPVARRGDVRSACDSVLVTTVALGQSWSPSGGGHESAESAFVPVRALDISSKLVVRGGVEPPTFRFSGGFARPDESTIDHLNRPNDVSERHDVQDWPLASTAIVSTALATCISIRFAPEAGGQARAITHSGTSLKIDSGPLAVGLFVPKPSRGADG